MQKAGGFGRTMREFLLRDLPGDAERAAQKIAQEAGRVASGSLLVEHELPDWLGEVLEGLEDGDLLKGAGHKYIRRVPKAGGKGWRYFYTVTGGQGLGHHSEFVKGASFKVKDAGKEGHFHVEEDHGEEVTLRHDESGKSARVSKKALAGMLHAEHAEALGAVKQRAAQALEQAKKTGTAKQQEKAAALAQKYGVVANGGPSPKPIFAPFIESDIIIEKPRTQKRKRQNGTDGETVIELRMPSYKIDSEDWHKIPHTNRLNARITARVDWETGRPAKKTDKTWFVSSGNKLLALDLSQDDAISVAKKYIMSSLEDDSK